MTPGALALVAEFETAAKATRAAEEELRKRLTEQITSIERQRAFAFRRTRLVRSLAAAVEAGTANPEGEGDATEIEAKVWSKQRRCVRDELGWTGEPFMTYRGSGCTTCNGTSYKGRIALYEVMPLDEVLRQSGHFGPRVEVPDDLRVVTARFPTQLRYEAENREVTLAEYKGKADVVLIFYCFDWGSI